MHPSFSTPIPLTSDELQVSFPEGLGHVVILTLNRPKSLNAMTPTMQADLQRVLQWYDDEPSLWVAILTGAGRIFCAGADLKAWNTAQSSGVTDEQEGVARSIYGFGSVSRRSTSCKPLIAAVNGGAYGGGTEMILNCDLVVTDESAKFALPEVKRGVVAAQGGIPRLVSIAGRQLASEMLLLGRTISAQEAYTRFGFVNAVVPKEQVLSQALAWARDLVENSPDAVQSTKRGIVLGWQHGNVETATIAHVWASESKRTYKGDNIKKKLFTNIVLVALQHIANIKEGLKAFSEKRKPVWSNPSKL